MKSTAIVLLSTALLALLVTACGDGDDVPTGLEIVDTVLAAIESGDRAALTPLWRLEETPCHRGDRAGLLPQCEDGQETGALVRIFPANECVGLARNQANAESLSDLIVNRELGALYAVFAAPEDHHLGAKYVLIFEEQYPGQPSGVVRGYGVFLNDEQIVSTHADCGYSPEQTAERMGLTERIPADE